MEILRFNPRISDTKGDLTPRVVSSLLTPPQLGNETFSYRLLVNPGKNGHRRTFDPEKCPNMYETIIRVTPVEGAGNTEKKYQCTVRNGDEECAMCLLYIGVLLVEISC